MVSSDVCMCSHFHTNKYELYSYSNYHIFCKKKQYWIDCIIICKLMPWMYSICKVFQGFMDKDLLHLPSDTVGERQQWLFIYYLCTTYNTICMHIIVLWHIISYISNIVMYICILSYVHHRLVIILVSCYFFLVVLVIHCIHFLLYFNEYYESPSWLGRTVG